MCRAFGADLEDGFTPTPPKLGAVSAATLPEIFCKDVMVQQGCFADCYLLLNHEALSATDSMGILRNCSRRARSAAVTKVSSGSTVYFTQDLQENCDHMLREKSQYREHDTQNR
jgi:hypothetical protein